MFQCADAGKKSSESDASGGTNQFFDDCFLDKANEQPAPETTADSDAVESRHQPDSTARANTSPIAITAPTLDSTTAAVPIRTAFRSSCGR